MKPKSSRRRHAVILSTYVVGATLLLAKSASGQGGDFPDIHHSIPDGRAAAQGAAEAESDSPAKTIYDRSGPTASATPNPDMADKRDRFTFGKRKGAETVMTKESTNPIQKTKDGSSDATVSTGVFKESLLDIGPIGLPSGRMPAPSPTPSPRVNPVGSATTAAQPSASAKPSLSPGVTAAAPLATRSDLEITLGVSPAPHATATPPPR